MILVFRLFNTDYQGTLLKYSSLLLDPITVMRSKP